jgi:hypothetical protein
MRRFALAILFMISSELTSGQQQTYELLFLGDLYFGEYYQDGLASNNKINYLKSIGYQYSFQNIKTQMEEADYLIANLEATLAPYEPEYRISRPGTYRLWCRSDHWPWCPPGAGN